MKIRRLLSLFLVVSLVFSFSSIAVAEDLQDGSVQNEVIEDIQEPNQEEVLNDIDEGLVDTNEDIAQEAPIVEEQEEIINTEIPIVEEETAPIDNEPSQENTDGSQTQEENEESNTDEILALKEELENKEREIEELNQIINDLRKNQQPKNLAAPMMLGASPSNSENTITVSYTGEGSEAYHVSVPATIAPGESGDIVLEGTWASNRIVTVSADTSVVLTNNLNEAEQKELAVLFDGIELAGDDTQLSSISETISVSDISNALFGTWEGIFHYTVEIDDAPQSGAYFGDTFLTWGELKNRGNGNLYMYRAIAISDTSIGVGVFSSCPSLTSIVIQDGVESISDSAFYDCSGLTSIRIPDSVESIGDDAFSWCSGLTSIRIPNSVTSIGASTFAHCSSLTSIVLPNSVTGIGNNAFGDCMGLTSIRIPDGVTSIGDDAFSWCSGLTSIKIPDGVTYIGAYAFINCSGLTSVIYKGTTYTSQSALTSALTSVGVELGSEVFEGTGLLA